MFQMYGTLPVSLRVSAEKKPPPMPTSVLPPATGTIVKSSLGRAGNGFVGSGFSLELRGLSARAAPAATHVKTRAKVAQGHRKRMGHEIY